MRPYSGQFRSLSSRWNLIRVYTAMFLSVAALLGVLAAWSWYETQETFDPISIVAVAFPLSIAALFLGLVLIPILQDYCLREAEEDWQEAGRCQTNPGSVSRRWSPAGLLCPRRLTAAAHPGTLKLRLTGLLYSPVPQVAGAAASNPSTPAFALAFARRQKRLRKVFLSLPKTPVSALHKYAKDPDTTEMDLLAIARHQNADCAVLNEVSLRADNAASRVFDPRPMDIYETIARHPQAGQETLHSLATNTPERFNKDQLVRLQQAIASNQASSPETLTWLAENSQDYLVLQKVAQNPSSPEPAAVLAALREGEQETQVPTGVPSWARRLGTARPVTPSTTTKPSLYPASKAGNP